MMTASVALVDRYFELARRTETAAYFMQFAADAVVEDEGHTHRGIAEIEAWRTTVPPVHYAVLEVSTVEDEHVARTVISGEFPGSPVTLDFRFAFAADGRISSLTIRT